MTDNKDKELEKINKNFQKSTGMKVVQTPEPNKGKTEFAKDKNVRNGK